MHKLIKVFALLLGLGALASFMPDFALLSAAKAHDYSTADAKLKILHPWARPTPPKASVAAMYFSAENMGLDDTLLRVQCDCAQSVEMHGSQIDAKGTSSMRELKQVPIKAKQRIELAPGGMHVMLIGLKKQLVLGDRFEATLHFERAGKIAVQVHVEDRASDAQSSDANHEDHKHHEHKHH